MSASETTALEGRVALVTGGGSGFGRAIALRFAQEGARVVLSGRRPAPLDATADAIRTAGGEAAAIAGDVTVEADVEGMVRGTVERFGALDILINNAGAVFGRVTAEECTPEEFRRTLEANLMSAFLCSRAALPALRRRRGSIINVSSSVGRKGKANWGAYAVSKFGLEGFTQVLAAELESSGVRANSVNPGATRTEMRAAAYPDEDPESLPTPDDIAEIFIYLASDESLSVTGQTFDARDYLKTRK